MADSQLSFEDRSRIVSLITAKAIALDTKDDTRWWDLLDRFLSARTIETR